MLKRTWLLTSLALAAILAGCNQAPTPAPDTRAADAQAIRDLEAQSVKNWAAKDVDKIATFWADDADLFMPNMALIHGNAAIKTVVTDILKDPNIALEFTTTKVEVSKASDYGYSQGTYTMTTTDPKTKKAMTEKGKYVTVYKKQADGSWKAVADINNADAPAAPVKK